MARCDEWGHSELPLFEEHNVPSACFPQEAPQVGVGAKEGFAIHGQIGLQGPTEGVALAAPFGPPACKGLPLLGRVCASTRTSPVSLCSFGLPGQGLWGWPERLCA